MDKQALRAWVSARKKAMRDSQIEACSRDLAAQLEACPLYQQARALYGYLSFNQEVRTLPILQRALDQGKRVAVPKVYGRTMRFLWLENLAEVAPSSYGIPEPLADGPEADDPEALVLLPGLAFDRQGHRVGYGGGFYDRFLAEEPFHPTLALCYDFQVFNQLQTEAFDIPAHLVLSARVPEDV